MIVMKFGGTSVEDPECVERVACIVRDRLQLRPAVVVSAMGKTTQMLLDAARASATGDVKAAATIVDELRQRHLSHARSLIEGTRPVEFDTIREYFDDLRKLLEGLTVLGEVPPRGLDKILSYGELLSSVIVAGAFSQRGVPSVLMDARRFIKTDDRYGGASPIFAETNRLSRDAIGPVVESGSVPVIQGFIGSARHGATTTLGFEGSDYTAAIVGAAMGAYDIQIWKDVSGLMTADPAILSSARTVKTCTYQEAGELTYFGAKVLHPKAIYPAAERNIPVHIYNSRRPSATGTSISDHAVACRNAVKSIAYKRPISVIRLSANCKFESLGDEGGPQRQDRHTIDRVLNLALDRLNSRSSSALITMAAGSSALVAVESGALAGDNGRYLKDELRELGPVEFEDGRAIVSVIGEDLKNYPDLSSTMFGALRGVEIGMVVQGSSPIAVNLVISQQDVERVVSRLHELFFADADPSVFE